MMRIKYSWDMLVKGVDATSTRDEGEVMLGDGFSTRNRDEKDTPSFQALIIRNDLEMNISDGLKVRKPSRVE